MAVPALSNRERLVFCSSPISGQGSGANEDLGPLRFIVLALALEEGGGDLAPGLGVRDRHELAAVVELGSEADPLFVAAQKHAADRAQGPERDQADEAPAGGAGQQTRKIDPKRARAGKMEWF